jgi:nucleoid DNA-binding protein
MAAKKIVKKGSKKVMKKKAATKKVVKKGSKKVVKKAAKKVVSKKTEKKAKKIERVITGKIDAPKGDKMTQSELIQNMCNLTGLTRKESKGCLESLRQIGATEMKKRGVFMMPGMAKFVVKRKPATKARKGINPFTKEPCVFKAKPARNVVKARPMAGLKKQL